MVYLNTFDWHLDWIDSSLPFIVDTGYDGILVSPMTECKDEYHWWCLYQLYDFAIGNRNGSENLLRVVSAKVHECGLKFGHDTVLRHLGTRNTGEPIPHEDSNPDLWRFFVDNRNNNISSREDEVNSGWGLARLDYNNKELQEQYYRPFLNKLSQYFDFIRLDMGKHFALPNEGGSFWEFMDSIKKTTGMDIMAECLNTPSHLLYQYTQYCKPITDRYAQCGCGTVRFVESHDTYHHTDWGEGCTRNLTDTQRLDLFEALCKKHHNVMYFARPEDPTIFSDRMKQILHSGYKATRKED